ncbi:amino acid transporter AVT1I isoform X1 [Coffea arabica]|uniref:Amino acid transporter AVT1I-like isoform X1 n=2 Tax=Coffea arabica TaxID=13443 RepID=A0A6P6T6G1_COFAR|nr:amino acid transporter AVT1I-like isoform X1 [Coffea arabica]XP_027073766.1 amino acid transporter AVT1I-like isoform X1 [Coffea arabica]
MDPEEPGNGFSSRTIPLLVSSTSSSSSSNHTRDPIIIHSLSTSGNTSFYKTCFNGLNALSGVGILSVPYALSSGGWFSLMLLLVIASSALYTGLLIQRCMDMDPSIRSYPDIGERAFGAKGRALVSIVMNTELYMVATGFLILEGDNLYNLLPDVNFEIGGLKIGGRESFVIMVGLIILPTVWLNNMSILSYISASGVVASLLLLCSIFWAGEFDGIGFHHKGVLINWSGIPTAASLYSFCYCAHPVFPTLYTSMRDQRQFSKVLGICFLVCTISYALVAIVGYLMFGSELMSQITLNLPIDKISSRVAIYTTLVNPIAKYALMVIPIVNAIETRLPLNCHKRSYSLFVRTSLVLSTVIVSLAIPLFGYLMSLVGAFLSVTASAILPCLCFLKISGIYQTLGLEQLVMVGIVLMGISIMIVGTYTSVMEIVMHFVT